MSFPANPQDGDLYDSYGTSYRYDGNLNLWTLNIGDINNTDTPGDDESIQEFFNFPTGDYLDLVDDSPRLGEEIPNTIYYDCASIPKYKKVTIDLGDNIEI